MSNIIELFKSVDPHRKLPETILTAMASACSLVLERPADFAPAAKWLSEHYSEKVVAARLEREHLADLVRTLRVHRHKGTGNFAWSTYTRRLRLQQAGSDKERATLTEQLAKETITEARMRGIRLEAILLLPNTTSYPITYADGTAASNRTSMVRWRYAGRQNPDLFGHRIDADNYELVWHCEDERYRLLRVQLKAEWEEDRRNTHERPADRAWRFKLAAPAALEMGLPAGDQEEAQARIVVLIAFLVTYYKPMPPELAGEFCAWPWADTAQWFMTGYEPGRNTLLFGSAYEQQRGDQSNDYSEWVDFADLVARSVNVLKIGPPSDTNGGKKPPPADQKGAIDLGTWSDPMAKAEMARRLKITVKVFAAAYANKYEIKKLTERKYQIRTDQMSADARKKLDTPSQQI